MKLCRLRLKSIFWRMSATAFTLFALITPVASQAQRPSEAQKLAEMVPTASISQALGNIKEYCLSGTGACMFVLLGATIIALGAVFFTELMNAEEKQEAPAEEVPPASR